MKEGKENYLPTGMPQVEVQQGVCLFVFRRLPKYVQYLHSLGNYSNTWSVLRL